MCVLRTVCRGRFPARHMRYIKHNVQRGVLALAFRYLVTAHDRFPVMRTHIDTVRKPPTPRNIRYTGWSPRLNSGEARVCTSRRKQCNVRSIFRFIMTILHVPCNAIAFDRRTGKKARLYLRRDISRLSDAFIFGSLKCTTNRQTASDLTSTDATRAALMYVCTRYIHVYRHLFIASTALSDRFDWEIHSLITASRCGRPPRKSNKVRGGCPCL